MASATKEISLDKLVYRFGSAITLLKKKTTMREVAERLDFSAGFLSRYKKPQIYNLNPASYEDVFEVIDGLILEKFDKKWNDNSQAYEALADKKEPLNTKGEFNQKLLGLNGNWMGCFWNEEKTNLSSKYPADTPSDYFDVLRLQIWGEGNVACFLEATKMAGVVSLFGLNKIIINLEAEGRRLTVLGQIPLRDDLCTVDDITVAYTDSADDMITCGVAIFSRLDDEREMRPGSVRKAELEDISEFEKDYLLGKQLKAGQWKFLVK